MTDSKVMDSIRALSVEERGEFSLFLQSPLFVKGFEIEEIRHFFEILLLESEKGEESLLTKQTAHEKIFAQKTYNESRMDRLMFELNRLVNLFLVTKFYHREDNEVRRMLDLATIYRKKGLTFRLEKQNKKLKKEKEQLREESTDYFFTNYLISLEENVWLSLNAKLRSDLGLPDVIENLDMFYFAQRLEMLNRYLLLQRTTSIHMPEVIVTALQSSLPPQTYIEQSPLLHLTVKIHQLLLQEEPEVDGFQELRKLLIKYESRLTAESLQIFYTYLRNYCAFLLDLGNSKLEIEMHMIQRDNLARGYFYHQGKVLPNAFLSIITVALRSENIAWAENCLEEHKDRIIGENESHDFYAMCKALCLFAQKKFDDALDLIPFSSANTSYHLMARRLELKTYYELDSELLISKLEAFRMYVRRAGSTVFSPTMLELYTNFGNLMHQLVQSIPGDQKRCDQLLRRINEKKMVAERTWLLEKVEELRKKKLK